MSGDQRKLRPMIIPQPVPAVTRPFNAGPFTRLAAFSGFDEATTIESANPFPEKARSGARPEAKRSVGTLIAINNLPAHG